MRSRFKWRSSVTKLSATRKKSSKSIFRVAAKSPLSTPSTGADTNELHFDYCDRRSLGEAGLDIEGKHAEIAVSGRGPRFRQLQPAGGQVIALAERQAGGLRQVRKSGECLSQLQAAFRSTGSQRCGGKLLLRRNGLAAHALQRIRSPVWLRREPVAHHRSIVDLRSVQRSCVLFRRVSDGWARVRPISRRSLARQSRDLRSQSLSYHCHLHHHRIRRLLTYRNIRPLAASEVYNGMVSNMLFKLAFFHKMTRYRGDSTPPAAVEVEKSQSGVHLGQLPRVRRFDG